MAKKYIDAELLRKDIEKQIKEIKDAAERYTPNMGFFSAKLSGIYDVMSIIGSLQQEQPESSKGKFVFPNFLYARTVDNKTIDVSYAPQSMDAVEYIKNDHTEQPEVDLERDAVQFCFDKGLNITPYQAKTIASHFYELGKNSK
jgi:hypothetical protein